MCNVIFIISNIVGAIPCGCPIFDKLQYANYRGQQHVIAPFR